MATIVRRLAVYVVTAIVAITVDFFIPRIIPGNPVAAVLAKMQGVPRTPALLKSLELQFSAGTKVSLWSQYTHFWSNLFSGNLGPRPCSSRGCPARSSARRSRMCCSAGPSLVAGCR
jgi:peptide/nickel transport system permease protein